MSLSDRPRRTSVRISDRGPASRVSTFTTFSRAEPIERINMIRRGILASEAKRILSGLAVTQGSAMVALNISVATMNRRVSNKDRLPPAESERVFGVARLVGQLQNIVEESGNPHDFDATAWMSRLVERAAPGPGRHSPSRPAGYNGRSGPGLQYPRAYQECRLRVMRMVWRIATDAPRYGAGALPGTGAKLTGGRRTEKGASAAIRPTAAPSP